MKKAIHFLSCTVFLFTSCFLIPEYYETVYPSDIVIPGVGTLKYIRTPWDGGYVEEGLIIDNEMWIIALNDSNNKHTLYKGIDKKASVSITGAGDSYYLSQMLPTGNYINFLCEVSRGNNISYFITIRIDKATMSRQDIIMPVVDRPYRLSVYYNNESLLFVFKWDNSTKYYMLNDTGDTVIETTREESHFSASGYWLSPTPTPNDYFIPVTDDEGRYYRISSIRKGVGYAYVHSLEVSVDDGATWHKNDMGTNVPQSIILHNDSVYVLCDREFGGAIKTARGAVTFVGGGIHEFKWVMGSGKE